ncbi:hypothetical protein HDU86_000236 [Geranomyces michiganensis]|nr:hypothetical protein HDU86_000236 [Geranomyces michiganensis]
MAVPTVPAQAHPAAPQAAAAQQQPAGLKPAVARKASLNALIPLAAFTPFTPVLLALTALLGRFAPSYILYPLLAYVSLPPLYRTASHAWPLLPKFFSDTTQTQTLIPGRAVGRIDGDFVVFLIGARVNSESAFVSAATVRDLGKGMAAMQAELQKNPELGCLHIENFVNTDKSSAHSLSVQYWRSADLLHKYARSSLQQHLKPMMRNISHQRKSAEAGIYHETYLVRSGEYEAIYVNLPPFGLGVAGRLERPGTARTTMKQRLGQIDTPDFVGEDDPRTAEVE